MDVPVERRRLVVRGNSGRGSSATEGACGESGGAPVGSRPSDVFRARADAFVSKANECVAGACNPRHRGRGRRAGGIIQRDGAGVRRGSGNGSIREAGVPRRGPDFPLPGLSISHAARKRRCRRGAGRGRQAERRDDKRSFPQRLAAIRRPEAGVPPPGGTTRWPRDDAPGAEEATPTPAAFILIEPASPRRPPPTTGRPPSPSPSTARAPAGAARPSARR